jgi:hypothetical protein
VLSHLKPEQNLFFLIDFVELSGESNDKRCMVELLYLNHANHLRQMFFDSRDVSRFLEFCICEVLKAIALSRAVNVQIF